MEIKISIKEKVEACLRKNEVYQMPPNAMKIDNSM